MEDINKLFRQMEDLKNINDVVQKKIHRNLKILYKNIELFTKCIQDKRVEDAQHLLEENKMISEKNEDYLKQQAAIVDEMDEVKTKILVDNPEKTLKITVNGMIPFNEDHPFYRCINFLTMLRDHYEISEEYEMCSQINTHMKTIKA